MHLPQGGLLTMCIYVENEEWTYLSSGERRARVSHKCEECDRTIDPGEPYRYWTGIDEAMGQIVTQKMCQHCWNTIDLGAEFTGCPRNWYWSVVHDLSARDEGGFVADILYEHDLTISQKRAMVRCLRGYRRRWRDGHGNVLPLVTERAS
jgi:hypothetical protein